MSVFHGQLKKIEGKLVHVTLTDESSFNIFKDGLKDGDSVDVYMEIITDDGTLAQLARVHAMIRSLARHIGEDPVIMKLMVKKQAGFCFSHNVDGSEVLVCKSFGKMSKDELGQAIEACITIGGKVNFILK